LSPAWATIYYIDLNDVPRIGQLFGPCYCGGGPLYGSLLPSAAKPGDFINFGTVQIFSVFDDHDFGRGNPFFPYYWSGDTFILLDPADQAAILRQDNFQGVANISFSNDIWDQPAGSKGAPLNSSETFSLLYEIPDGATAYQIGWDGPGIYTAAVPEPSTWAMLLIGFAGMGAFSYRRRQRSTNSGSPQRQALQC
jgi:PEP-CTERM motif